MKLENGLTVAIPNWNHELLLPRAILSALRTIEILKSQGIPGEVVIVDDRSRDGSTTLLRQLEARYHQDGLRVLAFSKNAGLSAARNQALIYAQYRYIAFVDADNEIIPENMPTFLDALRDTRAAGVYGTIMLRTVTSDTSITAFSNESFQDRMFEGNYIDALAMFDRAQLVDEGGYVDQRWEDYEMWLHLATAGRQVIFVPTMFGYYYLLPGSISVDPAENKQLDALHTRMKRIFNQLKVRESIPLNARHSRYHPAIGYL